MIGVSWLRVLGEEFQKPYMKRLECFLGEENEREAEVFPPLAHLFGAFCETPFDQVKVVIVGQDPYHNVGQAHGLSFSVPLGVPIPPSLHNIYKELQDDLGIPPPSHGCLTRWARQGVLLLNATLTVRKNEPKSHFGQGWEQFTDAALHALFQRQKGIVFILWGKAAQDKCAQWSAPFCLVLKAPHPSPFSAHSGFFGSKPFSKTNQFLEKMGGPGIDWRLQEV